MRDRGHEDRQAVTSQLPGAGFRATLVVALVLAPSVLLRDPSSGAADVAMLTALFAGLFTLVEYASAAPVLVDFRAAPPVNRFRFAALALTALALALASGGAEEGASALSRLMMAVGLLLGHAMDVAASPVRMVLASLPADATPAQAQAFRAAAGLAYLVSLAMLTLFAIALRVRDWPDAPDSFNLWVNLPNFAPGAGADVVRRLRRAGSINLLLGIGAAYLAPPLAMWVGGGTGITILQSDLLLVWAMSTWAFLPTALFMRAIALHRLAAMVALRLRRLGADGAGEDPAFLPA